MNILRLLKLPATFLVIALVSLTPPLQAQQTGGTLTGTIIDNNTGKYLEGADVIVEGTSLRASSARSGGFDLRNVPVGAQKVTVTYPGMDAVTLTVVITGGQTATLPVRLGVASDVVTLSEFKVAGTKEGMAQAIALQKASDNSKIVAAGDQYGDIAEGNAAEYLKFMPGVGIDYNANDARAVTLRGMSTAFTDVTMNGNPVASATSGNLNRRFEFEQVAINNVETIEVYKTLTPDMKATSTGGSINMVTKSAFDRAGSLFTYRTYMQATGTALTFDKTEGWGQEKTRKILPGFDFNYAARLRENLGINLSYKNSQLYNDYPRSSYSWQYNPASGGLPTTPWINSWNIQNEQKVTRRQSLSGQVDYKLAENTKLSFNGQWNYYDLLFTDRVITLAPGNPSAALPIATQVTYGFGGTYIGQAGLGSAALQTINRSKTGVTWSSSASLTHDFMGGSKLQASTYWSQAYSKYRDVSRNWFSDATMTRTGLTLKFMNVGSAAPDYSATDSTGAAVNLNDISNYSMTQIRARPQTGVDTKDGLSLDFKTPLNTTIPITIKVGGRLDDTTRNIDNRVYNRTGTSTTTGFGGAYAITGNQLVNMVDYGFSQHPIGYGRPAYNFLNVYSAFAQLGGLSYLPYTPASDTIARFDDETNAAYARVDITPIKNFLIVAGVRYEERTTNIENRLSTLPKIITGQYHDDGYYPSVNLKYTPTSNLLFRFGAAQSIGLPDYSDLLPGAPYIRDPYTSSERGSISVFNPKLESYKVDNFDGGIEYYFNQTGFISASIFRKTLTNYIISVTQTLDAPSLSALGISSSSLGSPVDQYDVSYKFNVPDAGHYNGVELGYSQNFSFLPKPFNTLGLQLNATLLSVDPIKTKTVFNNSVADPNLNAALLESVNRGLEIAAVKRAFNATLTYRIGNLGFTLTSNYTGKVLKSANRSTVKYSDIAVNRYFFEYIYQSPRELVDFRMDYKINRKFTPYFQMRNVLKRAIVTSTQNMPSNRAEYGDPIYELGVRGVW